jgi:hypothetical protein
MIFNPRNILLTLMLTLVFGLAACATPTAPEAEVPLNEAEATSEPVLAINPTSESAAPSAATEAPAAFYPFSKAAASTVTVVHALKKASIWRAMPP